MAQSAKPVGSRKQPASSLPVAEQSLPEGKPIRRSRSASGPVPPKIAWAKGTELVGITLRVVPLQPSSLYAQYTIGLHAWLLDQIRAFDPQLSAMLHDDQAEKAFTISGLEGNLIPTAKEFRILPENQYCWNITAFSQPIVQWLAQWLQALPSTIDLRNAPLRIEQVEILHPPTTYAKLWQQAGDGDFNVSFSFTSPTSFRRHGHHFPLPVPYNLYHSYLRRWNLFSDRPVEPDDFLDWIDAAVIIVRHQIESCKVLAGKRGSVTGFTGAIELGLSAKARANDEMTQLFYALSHVAPYCGTGHKTTFGLGQTRLGATPSPTSISTPTIQDVLSGRIAELTELFKAQRYRTGGQRATKTAETWATILARRELGESLTTIAEDLEMPYTTVKSYVKLARQSLQADETKNHAMEL